MRKIRLSMVVLALSAALSVVLPGCGGGDEDGEGHAETSLLEEIVKRGTLKVGMSTFEPWAMKDKTGKLIGFEIDVATRLAEDMGVEIEFVPTQWAGIIPALMTGKFDVIISGMGITPQRNLKVNYSAPYYYSGLTLMANKELCKGFNPTKLEDFNRPDVVFAARMGVTAVNFIKKNLPKAQIREFDDMTMAYRANVTNKQQADIELAPELRELVPGVERE